MSNTTKRPKPLPILNIVGILCVGFLILSFSSSFSAIGTLDDWCFYNEYAEARAALNAADAQLNNLSSTSKVIDDNAGSSNITDASEETLKLVNRAIRELRATYGSHESLHWEHLDNIQVKECDIEPVLNSVVLAYYTPETNTIYCNRLELSKSQSGYRQLHTIAHELFHALLENDRSAFLNDNGAFHEGFAEYLAQDIYPVTTPSYYLNYCIAEVFVEDNGLDKAIELFMSGQAEESINQRLNKENLMQNINSQLYYLSYFPGTASASKIVLDVYLHYAKITDVDVNDHVNYAIMYVKPSFENLATMYYFDSLR